MDTTLTKKLIISLFEGRITPLQQSLIADWLSQPANAELYFLWLEEWERANPQFLPDADLAYQQSLARRPGVATYGTDTIPLNPFRRPAAWLWLAASVVAVLGLLGWGFRNALLYRQYETAYGEIQSITLPDGTGLTLNANSTLRLARWQFGTGTRDVYLRGEAAFSVRHLAGHQPFVVHTPDGLAVKVLGTEFVVYSRSRGSKVVLNRGRVQLSLPPALRQAPLLIAPGDVVTLSHRGGLAVQHRQRLSVHTAWMAHRFQFENTPLSEVTSRIAEQFGVQVSLADTALGSRTIGGTFRADSADELIEVVAQVLDLEAVRTGEHSYRLTRPAY